MITLTLANGEKIKAEYASVTPSNMLLVSIPADSMTVIRAFVDNCSTIESEDKSGHKMRFDGYPYIEYVNGSGGGTRLLLRRE